MNAIVERLGWTLLHFLWQGLAIGVFYAAVRRAVARRSGPNQRYLLACAALAAMMAAPLVTWRAMRPADVSATAAYPVRNIPPIRGAARAEGFTALPASVRAAVPGAHSATFLSWVVIVWLAGTMVFWARLAGGWWVAARMRSMLVRRAPPEWQRTLGRLSAQIGLSRPVWLLVSALVEAPAVVGWLRPVVLVPVGALSGLPAGYLEALLLHELAHIRRQDYLVNLLQSVAEALLFYHPAVWWVSGHIRAERELCCDDLAISVSGDVLTYANALVQLESCRPAHLSAAVAAHGGSLTGRIARLLGQPSAQSRPSVRAGLGSGLVAVTVLLTAAAYGLFAQPAFQSASIKPNTSNFAEPTHHPMGGGCQPGGCHFVNMSLKLLIQFAYADHGAAHWLPLLASQVIGGPAWIETGGYDIDAKAPGADTGQAWLMFQTLLANRFKLALHRETRDLPVYILTAARSGVKLPAAKPVSCISFPPGTTPHYVPGKVDCGYVGGLQYSAVERLGGRKLRMADFTGKLAMVVGRPVIDKTGFTGEFDLDLNFRADETTVVPGDPKRNGLPVDPNLPNLADALEQQLGLHVAPADAPVEVLVVDRAERPAAN